MSDRGGGGGGNDDDDDDDPAVVLLPYTRNRTTTTRTRNAASSARRRANAPALLMGGGGNGSNDGWFARKSSGMTDDAIRSRLTGGGGHDEGEGYGMVGDAIQGGIVAGGGSGRGGRGRRRRRREGGPRFAWEEEEEEEGGGGSSGRRKMGTAPAAQLTLMDIMDEQDEVEHSKPSGVGVAYHQDDGEPRSRRRRRRRDANPALEELAIATGTCHGGGGGGGPPPTSSDGGSTGRRLLAAMGYRSRLGMAFVPIGGGGRGGKDDRHHDDDNKEEEGGGGGGGGEEDDDDALARQMERGGGKRLARWLKSKRLRAVPVPSVDDDGYLSIPEPKTNLHGIGYDPFRDAPEFREHRERKLAMARERGRDRGGGRCGRGGGAYDEDGGGGGGGRRRRRRSGGEGDRYFTDDLRDDGRRRGAPWEEERVREGEEEDDDDDDDDDGAGAGGRRRQEQHHSRHHYAADRDYTDFVGTRDSGGFALDDDDDTNTYYPGDGGRGGGGGGGANDRVGGGGEYETEIRSPAASEEEDEGNEIEGGGGGLFGSGELRGRLGGHDARKGYSGKEKRRAGISGDGDGSAADAWSAWGMGVGGGGDDKGIVATRRTKTIDGRPPLSGFSLGRRRDFDKGDVGVDSETGPDAPVRWKGPIPPAGYVLRRHVFAAAKDNDGVVPSAEDDADCGLGLNLQRRREQRPSRSFVPSVLPPADNERHCRSTEASGPLLARDGTELNFHAVRESMKNRFVASAGTMDAPDIGAPPVIVDDDDNPSMRNLNEEEFVDVTSTTWVPTRLLCKRWGVPIPSTMGTSGVAAEGSTGGGRGRGGKEEDYFLRTVYEPAVAADRRRGGDGVMVSRTNGGEDAASKSEGVTMTSSSDDESDAVGPPPTRPSAEVFRAIFDAESDMDISSSDDNDDNGVDNNDGNNNDNDDENDDEIILTKGRDGSTAVHTREERGGGVTPEQNRDITNRLVKQQSINET
ncbi:hypothetical protein ACHAW5_002882 [Stephanodiscus triporus]|uniref:G-patch domain-containing protein n=1 Tax=Stephanodiscus triporus TaxID=2934178 RepID=A0ABD3MSW4_9STRA